MQIAQVMAGYSLGQADLLRRAMGKKIAEEMAKERPKFVKGAIENGVDEKKAGEVFDLLEKFANYGFNKSHAAAYAVVSYQTAYLKANYPVEFMAGVMNCDIHLTEKLAVYKREVDRLNIAVIPPCVNRSRARFDVADGALVYALGALKNVGVDAMRLLVDGRGDKPFATLLRHGPPGGPETRRQAALEMLARAGAFDQLDRNRRRVFDSLDGLVTYSAAVHEARASNQVSLFGEAGTDIPEPRMAQGRGLAAHRTAGRRTSGDRVLPVRPPAGRLRWCAETQEGSDTGRNRDAGQGRRHCRQDRGRGIVPARTQIGARQPLRLCAIVRPDGPV